MVPFVHASEAVFLVAVVNVFTPLHQEAAAVLLPLLAAFSPTVALAPEAITANSVTRLRTV